jgi:hypothetical protein
MNDRDTHVRAWWALFGVGVLSAGMAYGQGSLTARELFYAKPAASAPAKPPQAKAAKPTAKAARPEQPQTVVAKKEQPTVQYPSVPVLPASYGGTRPLGLRYALLRSVDGEYTEVDPETVFRSGDRIRVSVESNDEAYLYIVAKGTSGNWNLLFPNAEISKGSNLVSAGKTHTIPPPPGRFTFDEQAGEEQLFLVLSRRPEESLEKLIYSLSSGSVPIEEKKQPKQMMLAQNMAPINDDLVGRLRNTVLARDLIFEKVDEATPGVRKEKAAYVVNQSGSSDSRLVADLRLRHR